MARSSSFSVQRPRGLTTPTEPSAVIYEGRVSQRDLAEPTLITTTKATSIAIVATPAGMGWSPTATVATLPAWAGVQVTLSRTDHTIARRGIGLVGQCLSHPRSRPGFDSHFGLTRDFSGAPHPSPRRNNSHKTLCRNGLITNMLRCGDNRSSQTFSSLRPGHRGTVMDRGLV